MPLILVTGMPCSGKSTTSKLLCEFLKSKLEQSGDNRRVRIVTDTDTLDWDGRNIIYMSIAKEKELRSWLRAEAQRYMNLDEIVILDAAAYIKGYRYELHCTAKEAKTQYCIVENLIDIEMCWVWNEKLRDKYHDQVDPDAPELAYTRDTFDALVLRYEKCDENNRWDLPLFRITSPDEKLDLEGIYTSITKQAPLVQNKSHTQSTTTSTMFKHSRCDK